MIAALLVGMLSCAGLHAGDEAIVVLKHGRQLIGVVRESGADTLVIDQGGREISVECEEVVSVTEYAVPSERHVDTLEERAAKARATSARVELMGGRQQLGFGGGVGARHYLGTRFDIGAQYLQTREDPHSNGTLLKSDLPYERISEVDVLFGARISLWRLQLLQLLGRAGLGIATGVERGKFLFSDGNDDHFERVEFLTHCAVADATLMFRVHRRFDMGMRASGNANQVIPTRGAFLVFAFGI